MEDRRSIHSIHSYRSNRGLARPVSDISFIDEETLSPSSAASRALAARQSSNSNGGAGLAAPARGSTHGMNNHARKSVGSISAGGGALSVTVPSATNISSSNNSAFRKNAAEGGNRNNVYRGSNATNNNKLDYVTDISNLQKDIKIKNLNNVNNGITVIEVDKTKLEDSPRKKSDSLNEQDDSKNSKKKHSSKEKEKM